MKCVLIFSSVHQVMRTEKLLKGNGLEVDLIPVPREISSDCGIAVEISTESEEKAFLILRENKISIMECYTRDLRRKLEKRKKWESCIQ